MTETTTEIVKKFVSEKENWYVDSYDSYQEVLVENKETFAGIIAALEDRQIDIHIDAYTGNGYTVKVYR
jgi:hypothetical protein